MITRIERILKPRKEAMKGVNIGARTTCNFVLSADHEDLELAAFTVSTQSDLSSIIWPY
jgi:hypothetical protein